jgi:hypothetical protein
MIKNSHCYLILGRLRRGKSTNLELMKISGTNCLTARISELRKYGYRIFCKREAQKGITYYELLNKRTKIKVRSYRSKVSCASRLCGSNKNGICGRRELDIQFSKGHAYCTDYVPVVRTKRG